MITGRDFKTHTIRFPDGLHEELRAVAASNGRSFNSEVVDRLVASLSTARELDDQISRLIDEHVKAKVAARLKEIAAKIGDA